MKKSVSGLIGYSFTLTKLSHNDRKMSTQQLLVKLIKLTRQQGRTTLITHFETLNGQNPLILNCYNDDPTHVRKVDTVRRREGLKHGSRMCRFIERQIKSLVVGYTYQTNCLNNALA